MSALDLSADDRPPASGFLFELRFGADLEGLKTVRGHVRAVARQCGFDDLTAQDIVLRMFRCKSDLVIELRDFAPTVDPACIRPRESRHLRPGQHGTRLIHAIMHRVELTPAPDGPGNLLKLYKRLE